MDKLLSGVASIGGVLLGVYLYVKPTTYLIPAFLALLFLWIVLKAGERIVVKHQFMARACLELWALSGLIVVGLISNLVISLSVSAPDWFGLNAEENKKIAGILVGSITTFLGYSVVDEIRKGSGPFSVVTWVRAYLQRVAIDRDAQPGSTLSQICYDDYVNEHQISGWGWRARGERFRCL